MNNFDSLIYNNGGRGASPPFKTKDSLDFGRVSYLFFVPIMVPTVVIIKQINADAIESI